ncbi:MULTISPECIES: GntR family transcriptional regulator [unclassified Chelatococcus]|jgi:DNA-binding GntR family transcriptional regulator|uniref:GntR family transcriptional regulator n=1 Tax=unclassified Chelatococcus TaxID=2638111 RepID=UPI001BD04800|nr:MULTISPECIES: GntR family transcriptional regulator [unclassified Chelatococcus]CAH1651515.1 GntR family transcriptional regulator [Hyphomicrobiales bacterium]MBS7739869.1 GntR family transcriptional regulator [Chelatococcus sp. HY11]MBX3545513.1 GntR family transcriptional regulator [Chelatococcus sp.]MCO5078832.1 GntR family transcriptional regulator [Chelatococcus sp.]CAH1686254.1 GntR family transcriptional regulator [Hyphomicrobiales bacterium]
MASFVRATLADQAYRELRTRILNGQLAGGRRLLPEELAVELSISPTPIKEALLRLEADGLVVSPLRKGAVVRRFTSAEVEEIYEARIMIEMNAVHKLFGRHQMTPEFVASLENTLDRHAHFAQLDTPDDLAMALVFDREFHQKIILAAGNSLVAEWHMRLLEQTHTTFIYNAWDHIRSVGEHRKVIEAIAGGSLDQTCEALELHLQCSRRDALASVAAALESDNDGS